MASEAERYAEWVISSVAYWEERRAADEEPVLITEDEARRGVKVA